MTALDRKLFRDLWHLKGQATAICLVMACGVTLFVLSLTLVRSMERSQESYYDRYRFAQVFVHVKRAPDALAARLAEVPGVGSVQTRVVVDVTLDVEDMTEPASGRLISVPDRSPPLLNALYLRQGRFLEPGQSDEVLASEAFTEAHNLGPGDRVRAIINGRRRQLVIVGVVLSPEYVYQIRPGDFIPDDRRFGVFWMAHTELAAAFDMQGAFNDAALSLTPGASEPEVLARLDRLTASYGGLGAYGRADQVSNRYVSDEISKLRTTGFITPTIFLAVAAFLLQVVLSRLVGTQREQIAALKALGYSRLEVGLHYFKMVLVLVVIGAALGTVGGAWLAHYLTQLYTRFFRFPVPEYGIEPAVVLLALLASGGAATLGTLGAVRRAARLPPAEAMRPEPPARYRPSLLERWGLAGLFSQPTRMILRHLERQPLRAGLAILGIALAVSVLILGSFVADAVDYLMDFEFHCTQRQDVTVSFVEPESSRALHELCHLPGVRYGEAFRAVSVRLRSGPWWRRTGITGLPPGPVLQRLLDERGGPAPLPEEGLVLSGALAQALHVGVGDSLTVEVLEGERPTRRVQVTAIVSSYTGMAAYMDLRALHRLLHEGDALSGVNLAVDAAHADELYRRLKAMPHVAGVAVKEATVVSFQKTLAENLLRIRTLNVTFAIVIAFGVVYNTARVSLSERGRELATLRVLGFTRAEISFILLGELAILTLAAIPLGLVLGRGFAALVTTALATETYRIPLVIRTPTYAFAATVVLTAALLSGLVVRRRLDRLDLVAVLKASE
jgi:putative ABC transport system permease protein